MIRVGEVRLLPSFSGSRCPQALEQAPGVALSRPVDRHARLLAQCRGPKTGRFLSGVPRPEPQSGHHRSALPAARQRCALQRDLPRPARCRRLARMLVMPGSRNCRRDALPPLQCQRLVPSSAAAEILSRTPWSCDFGPLITRSEPLQSSNLAVTSIDPTAGTTLARARQVQRAAPRPVLFRWRGSGLPPDTVSAAR